MNNQGIEEKLKTLSMITLLSSRHYCHDQQNLCIEGWGTVDSLSHYWAD